MPTKPNVTFRNLPPDVLRLIAGKLNAASRVRLGATYKNENLQKNLNLKGLAKRREQELRNIVKLCAIMALWYGPDDVSIRIAKVISGGASVRKAAQQLGLRYYVRTTGYVHQLFEGDFFLCGLENGGYRITLAEFSPIRPLVHFERYDAEAVVATKIKPNIAHGDWNVIQSVLRDLNPTVRRMYREFDIFAHNNGNEIVFNNAVHDVNRGLNVHRARNNRRTANVANAANAANNNRRPWNDRNAWNRRHGPPKITWRRPTVPVQSPEHFVSDVMHMFPNSVHTQALQRALTGGSSGADRRLAQTTKAVYALLKNQGGHNATNLAKTADLLKSWRSYKRWHEKHGAATFAPGKRRKPMSNVHKWRLVMALATPLPTAPAQS